MHRIQLIEDDPVIAEQITKTLRQWDFEVYKTTNFQGVMEDFYQFNPHLVLLDLTLPYYNGYHWCAEMRKVSKVPIIFISSAGEDLNIIMAMTMGADDYLIKPFDLSVLEAKVKAMLRRTYDFGGGTEILEHRGVVLELLEMRVSYQGKSQELTKNEFKILEALLKKKAVLSREELMEHLWKSDAFVDDNTLSVNVARLRTTLKSLGCEDFILTKKGVGYYVQL